MSKFKKITIKDFALLFGTTPSEINQLCGAIITQDKILTYHPLNQQERDKVILEVLKNIHSPTLTKAGKKSKSRWEKGWGENLQNFIDSNYNLNELVPKYIRPKFPVRLFGNYVMPKDPQFELNFVKVLRAYIFKKYFFDVDAVYEFGCGTGCNLIQLAQLFPDKELHGLDWAIQSKQIIDLIAKHHYINVRGHAFNFYEPDYNLKMKNNSGVLMIGALEQVGEKYKKFFKYLKTQKPSIVVHVDSIIESYNQDSLVDYLAYYHDVKRNYLRGYLPYLKKLDDQGQVEILKIQKIACGGLPHDGYSLDVWRFK